MYRVMMRLACLCIVGVMFVSGVPVGSAEPGSDAVVNGGVIESNPPFLARLYNPPFVTGDKVQVESIFSWGGGCAFYRMMIDLYDSNNQFRTRWFRTVPGHYIDDYTLTTSDPTGVWHIRWRYIDCFTNSGYRYDYGRVLKWVSKAPISETTKDPAFTFNPNSGKLVMYGGCTGSTASDRTSLYSFSANSWSSSIGSSPGKRMGARMAYHAGQNLVVMFGGSVGSNGGCGTSTLYGDTWGFDGSTWTDLNPDCDPTYGCPAARYDHSMVYHQAGGEIVMFGGSSMDTYTWILDYDTSTSKWAWERRNPSPHPSARTGAAMTYDTWYGYASLFGGTDSGYTSNIWRYKRSSGWNQISPPGIPSGQPNLPMFAYDSHSDDLSYIADGRGTTFYTLSFGNAYNAWSARKMNSGGGASQAAAVYDTVHNVFIYTGGVRNGQESYETWALQT